MPPTNAKGGFGTKLYCDDGGGAGFVEIAEIGDIDGGGASHVLAEATNQASPSGWSEKIATGLKEADDITMPLAFIQGDASQGKLRAARDAGTKCNFRIVLSSGTQRISFAGFVAKIGRNFPMRDKIVSNVTLTPTGPIVEEPHP